MDEVITVSQAAKLLKVTPRRIQALINTGKLPAKMFGSVWMLFEKDVTSHKPGKAGRPKLK